MSTVPNIGVPTAYLTYLDPQITPILFAPKNATKLFGEAKKGDWTDAFMQFPIEEITGDVTPYSDFTNQVSSDINYEFPSREPPLVRSSNTLAASSVRLQKSSLVPRTVSTCTAWPTSRCTAS